MPSSCGGVCCQGQTGTPGVPGIPGIPGNNGIQGPTGPKGESLLGSKGDTGNHGMKGEQGETGVKGLPGKLGPRGPNGETGQQGERGLPGENILAAPTPPSIVAFSALLGNTVTGNEGKQLIFDNVITEIGDGYNSQTGVFTCSVPGLYFFTISFLSINSGTNPHVKLKMNGNHIFSVHDDHSGFYHMSGNSVVLILDIGDRVWLELGRSNVGVYDSSNRYSCFSGYLINAI